MAWALQKAGLAKAARRINRLSSGGGLNHALQPREGQPLQGGQIGPWIGTGLQVVIHEYAAILLPGLLLQRQGDQVAEALLGMVS
jgi:hypothetical protein